MNDLKRLCAQLFQLTLMIQLTDYLDTSSLTFEPTSQSKKSCWCSSLSYIEYRLSQVMLVANIMSGGNNEIDVSDWPISTSPWSFEGEWKYMICCFQFLFSSWERLRQCSAYQVGCGWEGGKTRESATGPFQIFATKLMINQPTARRFQSVK